MIRQVKLRHWGIFRTEWQSPILHDLADILGENGTGKSTLIDGISVALGLTHEAYLFENRSMSGYVNEGKEATIALLLDNSFQANGKRRFPHLKDAEYVTAAVRVRPTKNPVAQFILRGGDISLTHLDELQREWMTLKDYEALWKKARLPKQQRLQRIFRVNDIERVEKSDKADLENLFREYCSDPKVTEDLKEAEQEARTTKRHLAVLEDGREQARRELHTLENDHQEILTLKRKFEQVRYFEGQYRVASFHKVQHEYDHTVKAMGNAEREREKHEQRIQTLEGKIVHAEKLVSRADAAHEEQKQARGKAQERYNRLEAHKTEAIKAQARVEQEQSEYERLSVKCREREVVESDLEDVRAELEELTGQHAKIRDRSDSVAKRIATIEETGLPPEASACLEAIDAAGIQAKQARSFLPQDQPQGYEEALGRARYGLLVESKDLDEAITIARAHRYPGPISTLTSDAFTQQVFNGSVERDGFQDALGQYVVMGEQPILNPALKDELLAKLREEHASLTAEIRATHARFQEVRGRYATLDDEFRNAKRVQELEARRPEWDEVLKESEAMIAEAGNAQDHLFKIVDQVAATRTDLTRFGETLESLKSELSAELENEPEKLASAAEVLRIRVAELRVLAEPFLDKVGADYDDPDEHKRRWDDLAAKLDGVVEPQETDVSDLVARVKAAEADVKRRADEIGDMTGEVEAAQQKIQRLRKEMEAHERSQFRAFRTRIKALGTKYGVDCQIQRDPDKKNPGRYLLDFQVGNRHDAQGKIIRESMHRSSSSTGENTKACILFMMALTPEGNKSFYIFDEPAAAFSEENLEDMWQLFRETGHQVIITSTKPGDYGSDDVDIQLLRLRAEPKGIKNRKALGCMEFNNVHGREEFRLAV